jgi:ribonucleoside-diphosphate reductase alpha chain
MSEATCSQTIVLNAKRLIERDADFAKFAGRILLTVHLRGGARLGHPRDGMEGLKEAHRRAFRPYLKHGVEIGRLSPRLLELDLDKLATRSTRAPTSILTTSASRPSTTAT